MSTNSQILADLRYFAENASFQEIRSSFETSLKSFAASMIAPISPPAQKPASVPGGSGAGLVGDPLTMSGDAWEAAAHHVLAIRNQKPVNADTWRQIGDFLQDLPSVRS